MRTFRLALRKRASYVRLLSNRAALFIYRQVRTGRLEAAMQATPGRLFSPPGGVTEFERRADRRQITEPQPGARRKEMSSAGYVASLRC